MSRHLCAEREVNLVQACEGPGGSTLLGPPGPLAQGVASNLESPGRSAQVNGLPSPQQATECDLHLPLPRTGAHNLSGTEKALHSSATCPITKPALLSGQLVNCSLYLLGHDPQAVSCKKVIIPTLYLLSCPNAMSDQGRCMFHCVIIETLCYRALRGGLAASFLHPLHWLLHFLLLRNACR